VAELTLVTCFEVKGVWAKERGKGRVNFAKDVTYNRSVYRVWEKMIAMLLNTNRILVSCGCVWLLLVPTMGEDSVRGMFWAEEATTFFFQVLVAGISGF
jgi:hypothetical protein